MLNLTGGIILVLLCAFLGFKCWKLAGKEKYNKALYLIILMGILIRFFVSSDFYLHKWDEKYHALVAKNIIDNPLKPTLYKEALIPYNYEFWDSNHIWLHKQPFPLWTMALSMFLFGINEIALRLPTVILSTLGIWLTFYVGKYFFNEKAGIIAAFLFAINGLINELTGGRVATDHIDVYFLVFILLSVFFTVKNIETRNWRYNLLVGISLGIAILTKWLPALIVLLIWLLLNIDDQHSSKLTVFKKFLIVLISCGITFVPWQIFTNIQYPLEASLASADNWKHVTETLVNPDAPFYYHFQKMGLIYGELVYLPLVWFGYRIFKGSGINLKEISLAVWILIPYVFFSLVKTKMQAYTLFCAPAIFIIIGAFVTNFESKKINYPIVKKIIIALLFLLPIRYSIERIKPFDIMERNPNWAIELRQLNQTFGTEKTVIFNESRPHETMFYTNAIAHPRIPEIEWLEKIHNQGYTIYIRKTEEDSAEIMKLIKALGYIKIVE